MKKLLVILCAMFLLCVFTTSSYAYSVTVNYNAGTTQQTTALTGYATTGALMDGMAVTAYYLGGGFETLYWADIDSDSGGVTGTGWSMRADGNTFNSGAWSLTASSAITGLYIDAGVGDTVFDTVYSPYPGTPGSARGRNFAVTTSGSGTIVATYIDQVALTGNAPIGDLYRYLDIQFTDLGGWAGSLNFTADSDNI
ncbi:MAG: hypothetical protein JRH09_06505, partial [Deltaproteobacteria bacterium]|nr:hypothetical protein [Deltaproteobacteria bacterium]